MRARTLFLILAACSPAVLLVLLGISGRFLFLPWQTPEYGDEVEQDILAYRFPIVLAESLGHGPVPPEEDKVASSAYVWIAGHQAKALKSIPPASGNDYGTSGVRQQIENSKRNLLTRIIKIGKDYEATDPDRSAKFYCIALQLGEVGKYSSPISSSCSGQFQMLSMNGLFRINSSLSPDTKQNVLAALTEIHPDSKRIESNYARLTAMGKANGQTQSPQIGFFPQQITVEDKTTSLTSADVDNLIMMNAYRQALTNEERLLQGMQEAQLLFSDQKPSQEIPETMTKLIAQH